MPKSDHREPIKFVGMYFIDEHGEDYRTGQIIAQINDGYYLKQFPAYLNRWDSQQARNEGVSGH